MADFLLPEAEVSGGGLVVRQVGAQDGGQVEHRRGDGQPVGPLRRMALSRAVSTSRVACGLDSSTPAAPRSTAYSDARTDTGTTRRSGGRPAGPLPRAGGNSPLSWPELVRGAGVVAVASLRGVADQGGTSGTELRESTPAHS